MSKVSQQEMNRRVGLTIVGTIGFLAYRISGWRGILIYGYGIVVGGVGTMFMVDNNKPSLYTTLKRQVDERKYIDIGVGVEDHLGVTREQLNAAVMRLCDEGYHVHILPFTQKGTEHLFKMTILAVPKETS